MKNVFLGIGSNMGSRKSNLDEAVAKIRQLVGQVAIASSIYETEPWGFESKETFLNMVVKVTTDLAPSELLLTILLIESAMGRERGAVRYSSRLIDIDILLFSDEIIEEEHLKIPHPLMTQRRFVLVPICEIAPDEIHPVLKKPFSELLESCEDRGEVKKYMAPLPPEED